MAVIRHVTPAPLTPEEEAEWADRSAKRRAERAAEIETAIATVKCRTCKAEPGQPCTWKRQPYGQVVHAPRINRVLFSGNA